MNKHFGMLTAATLMLGLAACSSEEPIPGGEDNAFDGAGMYATIKLQLPRATRSQTTEWNGTTNSTDGNEAGKDYENNINNVTIVLATKDAQTNTYTPVTVGESNLEPVQGENTPTFTMLFKQDELLDFATQKVYIFTYCNTNLSAASFKTGESYDADFMHKIGEVAGIEQDKTPWKKTNFIMTNAANVQYKYDGDDETSNIPFVTLPSKEELQQKFNKPANAFDLGEVSVTRVCSRFDFRNGGVKKDNVYSIYKLGHAQNEDTRIADIEVLEMAPMNIAKEYYLLPRVSDDGTDANWDICGREFWNSANGGQGNWVVSPNWEMKKSDLTDALIAQKYLYPSTEDERNYATSYVYTSIKSLTEDDNSDTWDGTDITDKDDYKIWRYVTENTIPGKDYQKKGITTGIIFKAKITNPKENTPLALAMNDKKVVYERNGVIYGDAETLRTTAFAQGEDSPLYADVVKVFGAEVFEYDEVKADGVIKKEFKNPINDAEEGEGIFKIYRPSTDGNYYVYYTYYNRHNDNLNNGLMGTMEFGTVRNNIYKIQINTISEFGHTELPKDDPDPENPPTPDENPKTYFKVTCKVLNWMVRVNGIDF